MVSSFDITGRVRAAIASSKKGRMDLSMLLPYHQIEIDEKPHEKNIDTGRLLDQESDQLLEWTGFSLGEIKNPGLHVGSLIHDKQFVTPSRVFPLPGSVRSTMQELYEINYTSGRLETPEQLVIIGIVHRHPFTEGMPHSSTSHDDPNLSSHSYGYPFEFMSQHPAVFQGIGQYTVESKPGFIVLNGATPYQATLELPLDQADEESAFLQSLGINPNSLDNAGGLSGLLQAYFEKHGEMKAFQNRYVSVFTSLIYNKDGTEVFGEISMVVRNAITGITQDAFEADVIPVSSGRGLSYIRSGLRDEVLEKIRWYSPPAVPTITSRLQRFQAIPVQPPPTIITSIAQDTEQIIERFYIKACLYITEEAEYSLYVHDLLTCMQSGFSLTDSVNLLGDVPYCNRAEEFISTKHLNLASVRDGIINGTMTEGWSKEYEFIKQFVEKSIPEQTQLVKEYIPKNLLVK